MTRAAVVLSLCVSVVFSFTHVRAEETTKEASLSRPAPKSTEKPTYLRIPVRGVIGTDFTAAGMKSLLKQATGLKATVVVLEVDTPGGAVAEAEKIVDVIIEAKGVRFVALVRKALSAGAAITLACREIYMTETATIGAATPYIPDRRGRPKYLPRDVAEKMQSVWRAVCRKAAQQGGHPGILAEAMVDQGFALTMRKEKGRVMLERNGTGKPLKAHGRVLTLTAREAVSCDLARGVVRDLAGLSRELGMPNWLPLVQARVVGGNTGTASPGDLYRLLLQKAASMDLTCAPLTELQEKVAIRKWNAWFKKQKFVGQKMEWLATLTEVGEHKIRVQGRSAASQEEMTLMDHLNAELTKTQGLLRVAKAELDKRPDPSASFSSAREERQLKYKVVVGHQQKIARILRDLRKVKECPFAVRASCPEHLPVTIIGWASKSSESFLATAKADSEIPLSGTITDLKFLRAEDGTFDLQVLLHPCVAGPTEPARKPVKRPRAPETPETRAKKMLGLAESYRSNKMTDKAKELLESIIEQYPKTKAAEQAREQIKAMDK